MIKILFLAANPRHTPKLALQAEADAIADALRRAKYGGHFEFVTEYAVRVDQLQELLLQHRPHVVHFSGHGTGDGEIILEDKDGSARAVTPEALSNTFALFHEDIRLVVINACFSQPQAEAIAQHVPGVVGMTAQVKDAPAIAFAVEFYRALAYGRDVRRAFDLGRNQLEHTSHREFIYQENQRRTEPDFWIARYPVTYAQYRAFLVARDGFVNARWWRGLAAPDGHSDAPGEQRFPYWNHPAENVSWYDAIAFCRWLTVKVNAQVEAQAEGWKKLLPSGWDMRQSLRITLPTKWQWEKAARGHDGRQFPWGKEYISGNANIDETASIIGTKVGPHYLQKTSAVGMYPQAVSPYGVMDLSGNVWEWCLNEYEKPDRTQEEGSKDRVLRGGSWNNNVDNASALARNRNWNNNRNDNIGFRVVAVPSSTLFRPFSGGVAFVVATSVAFAPAAGPPQPIRFRQCRLTSLKWSADRGEGEERRRAGLVCTRMRRRWATDRTTNRWD